jgi:hypothetical protein
MVKKYENISRREFLYKFFDLWNLIQNKEYRLTEKEILLFVEFLLLGEKYKYFRFNTKAKNEVRALLKDRVNWVISDQNLSQLLASLEKKGVIQKDNDSVRYILPYFEHLISPENKEFKLSLDFKLK